MTGLLTDASVFDPAAIDSQTRELNARIEAAMMAAPARWEMPVEVERGLRGLGGGVLPIPQQNPDAQALAIPGPGGDLGLRIIRPPGSVRGIYLHFHGGGYSLGSAASQDQMLTSIAKAADAAVVSVEYRLAPEHPYPAAQADGEAAALWVIRNAKAEFGSDRIVAGGESAGAHLALTTALRLRDRHGLTPFAGLNLSQGAYDLRLTPGARLWGERRLVLNTPTLKCHLDRYLRDADRESPDVSPFFADLRRMPSALFTVGTLDPCLEDSLFMHTRWLVAGNTAQLALYPGGIHGFTLMPEALGKRAAGRIEQFIGECF